MSAYLGQNFLKDSSIISRIVAKIVSLCKEHNLTTIFEIGPGRGAITKKLLALDKQLFLFEKDETLKPSLESLVQNIQHTTCNMQHGIVRWDILDLDGQAFLEQKWLKINEILVFGNLPYYITSPILRKFFGQGEKRYLAGLVMIQKEVGDKIRHDAVKKSYLWRLLNFHYTVKYAKTVPAKAFSPAPKVQSCLITLIAKEHNDPRYTKVNFERMVGLLDQISGSKRKTLGKIWKMKVKNWERSYALPNYLAGKRLEELEWDDMRQILSPTLIA